MPAKGYRKPQPLDRQVYVRYPAPQFEEMKSDARDRNMRISDLVRALTAAYYKRQ